MPAEGGANVLTLRWMILGEWRAHPGRVAVAALAIAIGVALGFAVHLVNRSALDEFSRAIQAVNGDADLQVHATTATGFDEALYPKVARLAGVAVASPVVELTARSDGSTPITLLGLDLLRSAPATPSLVATPLAGAAFEDREAVFSDDGIALSAAALQALGRRPGDSLDVIAAGHAARLRITGTLPGVSEDQKVGVLDIAAAQWRFGQLGRLQRLDLKLSPGVDVAGVEARLREVLPPDAEIVTAQSAARRSDSLSRAYRVNLEMLAMVALLTGGFLVYSAQSLSVSLRRPQFALVRVLGLSRWGLLSQLIIEGVLVGASGAAAGVAFGLALADLALRLLGGDLGGGFFAGSTPHLSADPSAMTVFLALGVLVALAGSLFPALEAGRVAPAIALKTAGDTVDPRHRPKAWAAFVLLTAGAAAAFAPPIGGLPLAGYAAIGLMLAGGVAAMPWLSRALLSPLRALPNPSPPLALALDRLWGAPSQATVALCGIVASVSLMVAMAVMVTSFRGSVEDWLLQVLPSDLYLRVDTLGGGLDAATQARLAATPGVAHIDFRRTTVLRLDPERPPVTLTAADIDPSRPGRVLTLQSRRPIPPGATPVWISEPFARLYHRRPGEWMTLPLGGTVAPVFIGGVWRDYARQFGAVALASADYARLTGDRSSSEAGVDLEPGTPPAKAIAALRAALPSELSGQVSFARPREIRSIALRLFDRSFAATYALEAVAIFVGLTGVIATFSAQTLARTKEFGMLRHIGVKRRQILQMLALEGGLLGAVGVAAGLGLGGAMSQVLIHVVNPQSFNWTMETRLPWVLLASLAVALVGASAAAAILAGRGATSTGAIFAVREDW